jgi:uncharacterized membrane protein YadS
MLLPVILWAAMITRARDTGEGGKRPPLLPWFGVAFVALAGVNSAGWIAPGLQSLGNDVARWCLVVAISALGMKTHLKEIVSVGFRPVLLMVGETVFLAGLFLLALRYV